MIASAVRHTSSDHRSIPGEFSNCPAVCTVETRYPPEWLNDTDADTPVMQEDQVTHEEAWHAMESLVDAGLVRNIGVCKYNVTLMRDLLNYSRIPLVSYRNTFSN